MTLTLNRAPDCLTVSWSPDCPLLESQSDQAESAGGRCEKTPHLLGESQLPAQAILGNGWPLLSVKQKVDLLNWLQCH